MILPTASPARLPHTSEPQKNTIPSSNFHAQLVGRFGVALFLQSLLATCYGYWRIFQLFADYDDEGYLMITVKQFLEGLPLYKAVFTSYGPGYYLYKYVLQFSGRIPVTHDWVRFTALGAWLVISVLCAWTVFKLTQSAALGLVVHWLTFLTVGKGICAEPGHPQELCGLLIALVFVAIAIAENGTLRHAMVLFGIVFAGLLLTKINIGVFLGIALSQSFLACSSKSGISRAAWIACAAGAVALPFALMRPELHIRSALYLSLTIALSAVALLIVTNQTASGLLKGRDWLLFLGSCGASALLIGGFAILRGTTASMLMSGVVFQPIRRVGIFVLLLPITKFAVLGAMVGVAFAMWLALRSKSGGNAMRSGPPVLLLIGNKTIWSAPILVLLKGVFGLAVMVCAALKEYVLLTELAAPFVWLVLVAPSASPFQRFQRIALASVALFQILVAYPIAGSQVFFGVMPTLIVAAVCLHDFTEGLSLWKSRSAKIPLFTMLLTVVFIVSHSLYKASNVRQHYAANPPLALPGASHLRLPPTQTVRFQSLVRALRANGGRFITLPGMNSFYFWTEQDPPTSLNMTHWMTLFDDDQQQQIVNAIVNDQNLAVVYSHELLRFWERPVISSGSLVRYIRANFQTVAACGGYELMLRKGRSRDVATLTDQCRSQNN